MVTRSMLGARLRWGGAWVVAVVAMAMAPPAVHAARTGPVSSAISRPVPDVALEVKVGPGIVEAAELRRWVDDEGRRVLDGLPEAPKRRGSLRVEIGGALYEYQVTVTAVREGAVVGTPSTWACECSNEELLARLRGELVAAAGVLEAAAEPHAIQAASSQPPADPGETVAVVKRISAGEVFGLTLFVVGVAGVATGAAFVVKGTDDARLDPAQFEVGLEDDYGRPGLPILIAGAGVASTGLVVYILQRASRRKRSNLAIAPTGIGIGQTFGLVVSGRFR